MGIIVYPYKTGSHSAKLLARAVGGKVRGSSSKVIKPNDHIVNWGCSMLPDWYHPKLDILNDPVCVGVASNKLAAFTVLSRDKNIQIPRFTTKASEAKKWQTSIMLRSILTGHGGKGCFYHDFGLGDIPKDVTQTAKLITEYVKKYREYRIHVFNGKPILIQQKRLMKDFHGDKTISLAIRNHCNGWVFAVNDIDQPSPQVLEQSNLACKALQLDFGAVDVIWNDKRGAFVLEVNTAPGIEGDSTLNAYKVAINERWN